MESTQLIKSQQQLDEIKHEFQMAKLDAEIKRLESIKRRAIIDSQNQQIEILKLEIEKSNLELQIRELDQMSNS